MKAEGGGGGGGGKRGGGGGGGGGGMKKLVDLPLTLCNVKPVSQGARFYLEVRSPTEQLQLQALSLAAMREWADAINAGVASAFGTAHAVRTQGLQPRTSAVL